MPCRMISFSASAAQSGWRSTPRERIDQEIRFAHRELNEAQLLEIAVQAIRLGIDRDAIDRAKLRQDLRELSVGRDHRNPASKSSAFVFVACRFLINISIASSGGSAAIALRSSCTRSHSSGW